MMQIDEIDNINQQIIDDDDNAAIIDSDASDIDEEEASPLLSALDDLESRVVTALNEFKSHPGTVGSTATSAGSVKQSIHQELASILRPVVEVSAHTGPSTARALASSYPQNYTIEMCVDEIYTRINSELILPVILESAQSDTIPAKRSASLALFHTLHSEWCKAGSYLDGSTSAPSLAGPYGPGISPGSGHVSAPPFNPAEGQRRNQIKSARRAELLRRWVQSAIPNLTPGTFTNATLDASAAGRGVLSASAALKPCLRYMAERIGSADDAGALRLFLPVMRMIEGVLGRLFLERTRGGESTSMDKKGQVEGDALRSSCIKFLEIVVLCFSKKELPFQAASRMKKDNVANDFSLEDLPPGHPIITRESLEEIGDYAFSTLRGLVLLGGQAAIDPNLLLAAAASSSSGSNFMGGSNPFTPILDILKPAALAFLNFETDAEKAEAAGGDKNAFTLDRANIELDFGLSQKSYSLSINAIQMLATKRPVYFKESSVCLARRAIDPPGTSDNDGVLLSKAAITGIRTHLRSSCLTLLRHFLSVTSGSWEVLADALKQAGMETQADRALKASKQQLNLMKGGRAARNRAAVFYEWDTSADDSRAAKRQRDTDDAQARVRAAKMARGLGSGIQLPTSMVDACELVLLNLDNLPPKRPPVASSKQRKQPIDLDFVVDAVVSNGASLTMEENHWYDRDGGDGWAIEEGEVGEDGRPVLTFKMNSSVLDAGMKIAQGEKVKDTEKAFAEQSKLASSMAFSRVLMSSSNARSSAVADFGKQIAARLALTLEGVKAASEIERSHVMTVEAVESSIKKNAETEEELAGALEFALENPLVSSSLAYDLTPKGLSSDENDVSNAAASTSALAMRILNEAYVCSFNEDKAKYEKCLDLFVSSVVNACDLSNQNPKDNERKRIANAAASSLPHQLGAAPFLTPSSLNLVSSLCDIDEVVKKFSTKTPSQTIAEAAAARTAKAAAEKRATAALLILRDVAFQRDALRGSAVDCAVAIASGRLPASAQIEDKALKLVMNVIFPKNVDCADKVITSGAKELEFATRFAIENHEKIKKANEASARKKEKHGYSSKSALAPQSDEEKQALDRVRKPVVLVMALAVRRPEIIKAIMENGCRDGADVLAKAIRTNMPKLARAAATKHGAAKIAVQVADMASEKEAPLLICFLDNLVTAADKSLPSQELIDACQEIQKARLDADGKPDIRYIMPVVSGIKRVELLKELPDFVKGSDEILKTALHRMSERLGRYSMIFRDEPDPTENTLRGMSSCEQMVYLHQLDFHAIGIPQKRYLDVIRVCLEDDEVFNDRVVQAALDYISGKFLEGESLPLAYMRTIILTCSKHESLHSWICHVLLPRLVEGQVHSDKRQWEGWMRCAKMLENTGDQGISSLEAIEKLPEEQKKMYRAKYPKK
eukprot:scaffold7407_cov120-Skeletonema_dohrnii-CCMP3373.AAC.10